MAGIFNLFGSINEPDKHHAVKSVMQSKATGVIGTFPKQGVFAKPKGLSIRSSSDLNIPSAFHPADEQGIKEHLSSKSTQLDTRGRAASPQNKAPSVSKLNMKPTKMEEASQRKRSPTDEILKSRQILDDSVFKEPLPYQKHAKLILYPEPENLAPYYDMEPDLDLVSVDTEFKKFLRIKEEENLYNDEGFESEPDDLLLVDIPAIRLSPILSYKERAESPGLPEISDYEDF